jgi:glycosyltransferase involved in cell wall biosynthesis
MKLAVAQLLPALDLGGVERGTVEVAEELMRRGHHAIVVSAGGRLRQRLLATGADHLDWAIGRKSPAVLCYLPRLRRLFRHVHIVHARSRLPAWLSFLAWRSLPASARPHFITTVHGPYTVNAYSAAMIKGERVIAISEFIRDYIISNYPEVDPARIQVIHRGVDPSDYPYGFCPNEQWLQRWKAEYPQTQGRLLLVLPARITRWKGQEEFLELLAGLKQRGLDVQGLVVGGIHPRRQSFFTELQQLAARLDISNRVLFLGERTDLREILAISNIALSLTSEPEAFGRTTAEALSLGTPVIGYDHGGTGEILRSVYPVGLCPLGDLNIVVERVAAFSQSAPPVPQLQPFTLEAMLDKTLALYEGVAAA